MKKILEVFVAEWRHNPLNVIAGLGGGVLLPWIVINVVAFWAYIDHGFPLQTGWHQLAIWTLEALANPES